MARTAHQRTTELAFSEGYQGCLADLAAALTDGGIGRLLEWASDNAIDPAHAAEFRKAQAAVSR